MKKILVSACLLGHNVKYNGKNNFNKFVDALKNKYEIIPICPEVDGGLSIPRIPSEIRNNKVINQNNEDVTSFYLRGINRILDLIKNNKIEFIVLKEKSPACGVHFVYDGTFSHKLINGQGFLASHIANIPIYSENDIEKMLL